MFFIFLEFLTKDKVLKPSGSLLRNLQEPLESAPIKNPVFWDVTHYSPVDVYRRFVGTYFICLQRCRVGYERYKQPFHLHLPGLLLHSEHRGCICLITSAHFHEVSRHRFPKHPVETYLAACEPGC
jgi:hypothetical protein